LLGEIDGDGNASPSATQQTAEPIVAAAEEGGISPKIGGPSGRYGSKGRYAVSKPSVTPTLSNGLITSSKLRYSTSKGPSRASNSDDSEPPSLANSIDSLPPKPTTAPVLKDGRLAIDQDEDVLARYVEERYGRNLDLSLAPLAKLAMRRRIAGVLKETPGQSIPVERANKTENEQSTRGVASLTEEDVWLYPGGMSAIFHAHQLAMGARAAMGKDIGKSVCFG
jgi:cystathionine gamma-synthase